MAMARVVLKSRITSVSHGPSIWSPLAVAVVLSSIQQIRRCCQTNSNSSQSGQDGCPLCGAGTTPLGKSGGAVRLEFVPAREVAFLVEMVAGEAGTEANFCRARIRGAGALPVPGVRPTVLAHRFLEEFQCGLLVTCLCRDACQHRALMIDSAPRGAFFRSLPPSRTDSMTISWTRSRSSCRC